MKPRSKQTSGEGKGRACQRRRGPVRTCLFTWVAFTPFTPPHPTLHPLHPFFGASPPSTPHPSPPSPPPPHPSLHPPFRPLTFTPPSDPDPSPPSTPFTPQRVTESRLPPPFSIQRGHGVTPAQVYVSPAATTRISVHVTHTPVQFYGSWIRPFHTARFTQFRLFPKL